MNDSHRFDTSDYDLYNIYDIELKNKKDENNGKIMLEFVGLRSKMYASRTASYDFNKKLVKKSKGSTKASLKTITFENYKDCGFKNRSDEKSQRLIKSKHHTVYTVKQEKVVLSPNDDKRIVIRFATDTKPWGYHISHVI